MLEKVRVGVDAKRAFCNFRGLGNYSRLLIEGLLHWADDEVDLSLFTPRVSLSEYQAWPSGNARRVEPKGFRRLFPELWRGFGQVRDWQHLDLDLYHGLSHDLPWNVKGAQSKIRTLVTIHDLIFIRYPELYPVVDRLMYSRKVKHSCAVADSIIAISEQTKQDLLDFLKVPEEKITVLYQAVHPRYYKAEQIEKGVENKTPSVSSPYFLFVGAFEERKNILRLLKAFARCQKTTGHQLVLIGRGGLQTQIEELVRSLSIEKFVRILPSVSSQELPQYYQQATAVTYPSLFEGFGLPIVEAMMSETLVLTSSGSCFPEAGGPGAFYIDPLSEDDMSQKLIEIAQLNLADRARRIQLGIEHCQRFHWRSTTEKLVSHYRQLRAR